MAIDGGPAVAVVEQVRAVGWSHGPGDNPGRRDARQGRRRPAGAVPGAVRGSAGPEGAAAPDGAAVPPEPGRRLDLRL